MGDASDGQFVIPGFGPIPASSLPQIPGLSPGAPAPAVPGLTPDLKAQLLAQAPSVPDTQAKDMLEVVDATPYGHKQMLTRYGIGAGVGLLAGFVASKLFGKRRR